MKRSFPSKKIKMHGNWLMLTWSENSWMNGFRIVRNASFLSLLFILIVSASLSGCMKSKTSADGKTTGLELKSAELYVTAPTDSLRITRMPELQFGTLVNPDEHVATIMLDAGKTFQSIVGIGGALTDASAETFYKLPKAKQDELLDAYFSLDKGIGYSLCRTHINSCDFSSDSYAYAAEANDKELKSFSIEHDKKFRIPLIKEALAKTEGKLQFFASP